MASENQKNNRWPFSIGLVAVKTSETLDDWRLDDEGDTADDVETKEHSTFCIRHSVATSIDSGQRLDAGLETNSSFLRHTFKFKKNKINSKAFQFINFQMFSNLEMVMVTEKSDAVIQDDDGRSRFGFDQLIGRYKRSGGWSRAPTVQLICVAVAPVGHRCYHDLLLIHHDRFFRDPFAG